MSITIRECGHSDETTSRWYVLHPDRCFYCEYLQKHPRPETRIGTRTTEYRQKKAEHMRNVWEGSEGDLGA